MSAPGLLSFLQAIVLLAGNFLFSQKSNCRNYPQKKVHLHFFCGQSICISSAIILSPLRGRG